VAVVGSGAGGLTAAVVAARSGLKVLVVEKADVFGGTTALSSGGAWIPDNPCMPSVDQHDSDDEARTYRHLVRDGYLIEAPTIAALAAKIHDSAQGDFGHTPNPNLGPLSWRRIEHRAGNDL
jgi:succinate dehydrogenase/fumarate reductase flavoprotein subunit